jgi:hypothetical protein
MPLRRNDDICDLQNLVGVTIAMIDAKTQRRVLCRVTFEALCDRAQIDNRGNDWMWAWQTYMRAIENIASRNFDAGRMPVDGRIIVNTLDLRNL